jgi:hypothetical protein
MKGFLTSNQIAYVLYHLELIIRIKNDIKDKIVFCKNSKEVSGKTNKIIFLLSEKEFNVLNIKRINGVPILFPVANCEKTWEITENNLIFYHDFLKSCFYLLSGYQEYSTSAKDHLGRFDYFQSVQHKLDFTNIPLVNYYFEMIIAGFNAFLRLNNQEIQKRKLFDPLGFFLTHDVDRVKLYNINNLLYCGKALLGFTHEKMPINYRLFSFIDAISGLFKNEDPHWTFPFMREIEKINGFKSVFFFLDHLPDQRNFELNSDKIRNLIALLEDEGCEIGMHSTIEAFHSKTEAVIMKNKLQKLIKSQIIGNRNHILLFNVPHSMKMLQELGYRYDTTLGFAYHEGFRNSFCYPFKLYDFENDIMMDHIWEIPLIVMDCTLFDYRKLSYAQAIDSINNLIDEIKKFGGIFTLLWHNSYFEERRYPGITKFYANLLQNFKENNVINVTGQEILSLLP